MRKNLTTDYESSAVNQGITTRRAAYAGIAGPVIFALLIIILTLLQYDFLIGLGWLPDLSTDVPWPSALALGPYGWIQVANFILFGLLLILFAVGLDREIVPVKWGKTGPALLVLAGIGLLLCAFPTDAHIANGPQTTNGLLHFVGFLIVGASTTFAAIILWQRLRKDSRWRGYDWYSLVAGIIALVSFFLPQNNFYLFLAAILSWIEVLAIRLLALSKQSAVQDLSRN